MPALCSMLSGTYYAQNDASIIGGSLVVKSLNKMVDSIAKTLNETVGPQFA